LVSGTIHVPYMHEDLKHRTPDDLIHEGYCSLTRNTTMCRQTDKEYELRDALFQYDGGLWSWDRRAMAAQVAYEEEVKRFGYTFSERQRELVRSFGD